MSFRMIQPRENPRSKFYWFRRRVPVAYRAFGMPVEIKFSLETTDRDEAVLRCQEENLKLERQWRANIVGTPPMELSHLQITALAGEFYAETVAAHRDEPGPAMGGTIVEETQRPQAGSRSVRSDRTCTRPSVSKRGPFCSGKESISSAKGSNPSCAPTSRRKNSQREPCCRMRSGTTRPTRRSPSGFRSSTTEFRREVRRAVE